MFANHDTLEHNHDMRGIRAQRHRVPGLLALDAVAITFEGHQRRREDAARALVEAVERRGHGLQRRTFFVLHRADGAPHLLEMPPLVRDLHAVLGQPCVQRGEIGKARHRCNHRA